MDKDKIIENLDNNLSNMFVDDFEKINNAKNSINEYFKEMEINYKYEYNEFCFDFIKYSKLLIESLDESQLLILNNDIFIFDTLTYMIENKIDDIIEDDTLKKDLIMKHELKK